MNQWRIDPMKEKRICMDVVTQCFSISACYRKNEMLWIVRNTLGLQTVLPKINQRSPNTIRDQSCHQHKTFGHRPQNSVHPMALWSNFNNNKNILCQQMPLALLQKNRIARGSFKDLLKSFRGRWGIVQFENIWKIPKQPKNVWKCRKHPNVSECMGTLSNVSE